MTNGMLITLIVVLVVVLLLLVGVLVFIIVFDEKEEKKEERTEQKFKEIKEKSMLNEIDTKIRVDKKKAINTVPKEETEETFELEKSTKATVARPMTREEREKATNPFGVDLTRRGAKTKKTNENNKFIK